jgi:hypothetical protein
MGASLTMIDCQYGHLARDGREHAIRPLDGTQRGATSTVDAGGRCVDAVERCDRLRRQRKHQLSKRKLEAL